jgi:hypothetical protein
MAKALDADADELGEDIERAWNESINSRRRQREQLASGSAEAAPVVTVELLDARPEAIRRPLALVAGRAYAAAWVQPRVMTSQSVDSSTGAVTVHDPPLERVEDRLLIVRDDGRFFADGVGLQGGRPLSELGLTVSLPHPLPPGKGWSGAGVKRYLAGDRPDPKEVFSRLVCVADRFLDFGRSLGDQRTMCELVACYVLATWLLDALNVIGYIWPNAEPGCGKTTVLLVIAEVAYLGQVILVGSSYPTLRDMADHGATLCFDDAEAVMDTKKTDPDKRTLLLAGNRRGANIAVKEQVGDQWETRYVNTFCPRLFSAIRLPDRVLGSRTIIVPLVRSGDEAKTKATPADDSYWPCDRRRLVDDLWALGLARLPDIPEQDRLAAAEAKLSGRALEPWRGILAVARWLERHHGLTGLHGRMEGISVAYQSEQADYQEGDPIPVLFRALMELACTAERGRAILVEPDAVAERMNRIAVAEDLAPKEEGKTFTNSHRVGWMLKRQRFKRGDRSERAKAWQVTREGIEAAAAAYGVKPDTEAEEGKHPESPEDPGPEPFLR